MPTLATKVPEPSPNSSGAGAAGPSQNPAREPVNSKTLTQQESALSRRFCSQWNSGKGNLHSYKVSTLPALLYFNRLRTRVRLPSWSEADYGSEEGAGEPRRTRNKEAELTHAVRARQRLRNHYVSNKERKHIPAESGPCTLALKSLSSPEA